jgi:homoserine dehydrogenase
MTQIYLAVVGVGGVGTAFLSQISSLPSPPTLIFLSRTTKQLYSSDRAPIPYSSATSDLSSSTSPLKSLDEIAHYLSKAPGPAVLVDNTSSQDVAEAYPEFLRNGVSIVTPNKKAFSSTTQLWDDIFSAVAKSNGKALVYHESSVGAGLPVISSLKDLIATGDSVTRIEGVFSGTMSFLFNSFAPVEENGAGGKWSKIVAQAKDAGYTEPDPRDDLNGMDVARKLTILARLAGLKISGPTGFPVQSLIPKELESAKSSAEFMEKLPQFDGEMEGYKEEAKKQGKVVRYVGSVDVGKGDVKVGLEMVDVGTPIAALKGSDNLICFYTKRYGANPLVIQGAGAGGEVTAMGVTSDMIKVMERLR